MAATPLHLSLHTPTWTPSLSLLPSHSPSAPAGVGYPSLPLSISDEALAARGFAVHRTAAGLDLAPRTASSPATGRIRVALEHTTAVERAAARRSPAAPVAFTRATGDGVFNAVIWDVVVDPGHQGIGLGKAMVERIVSNLVRAEVTTSRSTRASVTRVLGFYRLRVSGMVYSPKSKNDN